MISSQIDNIRACGVVTDKRLPRQDHGSHIECTVRHSSDDEGHACDLDKHKSAVHVVAGVRDGDGAFCGV